MKEILLDYSKQCGDEPEKGHNRWHPDIPPAVRADEGEEVVMQTRNAFDGQITPNTQASDLLQTDLGLVHPLTGPVYVNGAEPGDLLEVNVLNIEPASWGFTTILPGFGFLRDLFLEPHIVHWNMSDGFATSEQLPGVRVPEASFMGTIGVAPSRALRQEILLREEELLRRGGAVVGPTPQERCLPMSLSPPRACAPSRPASMAATWTSSSSPPEPACCCRCSPRARCSPPGTRTTPRATPSAAARP